MQDVEVIALRDNYNDRYRNGWEQTRYISFQIARIFQSNIKKPSDLIKFPWDADEPELSKEDRIEREQQMMKWLKITC